VVDQTLYKHWLIDEVETLRHENVALRNKIEILTEQLKQAMGMARNRKNKLRRKL
tara:strand:- start:822 stop:986 length:165 start_codon:yes stop_codon:yes gene_type:complete